MIFLRGSSVWAWAAVVGLGLASAACGGDDADDSNETGTGPTGADCPSDSDLTYDTFGAQFFDDYCTGCHSSENSGAERNGAPVGANWDSVENIREAGDFIDMRAAIGPDASNTSMPPAQAPNKPSDEERRQLGEWLACGAP